MDVKDLNLDEKTRKRLAKVGAETTDQLILAMYQPESERLISTPDMKRVEKALKEAGIIKYANEHKLQQRHRQVRDGRQHLDHERVLVHPRR